MGRKKNNNVPTLLQIHPNAKSRVKQYAKEQNIVEHQKDLINALNRMK